MAAWNYNSAEALEEVFPDTILDEAWLWKVKPDHPGGRWVSLGHLESLDDLQEALERKGGGTFRVSLVYAEGSVLEKAKAREEMAEKHGLKNLLFRYTVDELEDLEEDEEKEEKELSPGSSFGRRHGTLSGNEFPEVLEARIEVDRMRLENEKLKVLVEQRQLQRQLEAVEGGGAEKSWIPALLEKLGEKPRIDWPALIAALAPLIQAFIENQRSYLQSLLAAANPQAAQAMAGESGPPKLALEDWLALAERVAELGGGGEASEAKLVGSILRAVTEAKAPESLPQAPSSNGQRPQPSMPPQSPSAPSLSVITNPDRIQALAKARVQRFLGALVQEARAGSDPEAAAEALDKAWRLLPIECREALLSAVPETMGQALSRWIGIKEAEILQGLLHSDQNLKAWVEEILAIYRELEQVPAGEPGDDGKNQAQG